MTHTFDGLGVETPVLDLKALVKLAVFAAEGRPAPRMVEVGSWVGRTALAMAEAVPRATVYCVDTWEGTHAVYDRQDWQREAMPDPTGPLADQHGPDLVFHTFCRNVGPRLLRNVIPCRGRSTLWAASWPFPVDLVFLDADHTYEAVRADIQAWLPHVRPGGIMVGHDFWVCPGVNQAVEETFGPVQDVDTALVPNRLRLAGRHLWWVQVGEST